MKKLLLTTLVLVGIVLVYAVDDLWEMAKEISQTESDVKYVPAKSTHRVKYDGTLMDMVGQEPLDIEIQLGHTVGEDGTIVNSILGQINHKATPGSRNSRIVDQDHLDSALKFDATSIDSLSFRSLFAETDPQKINVKRARGTRKIGDYNCVVYDVRYSETGKREDELRGKMWLDTETGAPIMAEFKPPHQSAGEDVTMILQFNYNHDARRILLDKMEIKGKVAYQNKILDMENVSSFEEYFVLE